jgi:hypothetical protein
LGPALAQTEQDVSAVDHCSEYLSDKQDRIFPEDCVAEYHAGADNADYPKTDRQY